MMRTAIKFGAFVLVCLTFTMYLAFTIGNVSVTDPLARDYYTLNANFDDITGLLINDNVKIAGVVVGKVKGIEIVGGRARVTFTVRKGVALADDTKAAVRWRNLIGQRYVYLYPGKNTVTRLVNGKDIATTTSVVDLGELFNRLGPIVASIDNRQVNDFLDTMTQALDGNQDKLGKAIDDLAVLMKGLASRDQSIGRLVENLNTVAGVITNRDQQIRVMLDNLVLISATFSANTQVLDTALKEFGDFSTNLHAILANNSTEIDGIISNLDLITTDVVAPKLAELDSALKGVDAAARSIFDSSRLGEWLNQAILCFDTGPPPPGMTCKEPIFKQTSSTPAAKPIATDIGGRASTPTAGMNALEQLLLRSAR
jgi:phospholipid/cholesterol/gamma-HCH transport system substrate-binding protein